MTFGTHVHVHELGFSECAKSYVFQVRGAAPVAAQMLCLSQPCSDALPVAALPGGSHARLQQRACLQCAASIAHRGLLTRPCLLDQCSRKQKRLLTQNYSKNSVAGARQGSREYSMQQVVEQLGLGAKMPARKGGPGQPGPAQLPPPPGGRFVLPVSECEFTVNAALDELQRNAFPTISEQRPSRCTGTALQVGRPQGSV